MAKVSVVNWSQNLIFVAKSVILAYPIFFNCLVQGRLKKGFPSTKFQSETDVQNIILSYNYYKKVSDLQQQKKLSESA